MTQHGGVFVTGTDTGVGKTVVSAALLLAARARSRVRYWKPVQTGIEQDDDTREVMALTAGGPADVFDAGWRLPRPVSPHLAARWHGVHIEVADLARAWRSAPAATWVVEGAGGALVPLSDTERMVDLMRALALPAVVVARTTLGTINHTLLTLDVLRRHGITVAGVVMVGEANADNRDAITHHGATRVLATMPMLSHLSQAGIEGWLAAEPTSADTLAGVVA
jgi:dethiobiotin synthase